ncbi:MAG: class I SAM-dependent methyltransferase [Thaumarchaeota archaeon]|nr:class I SAM-dependent methyltransferase [Nitrososphaerota archaeon]
MNLHKGKPIWKSKKYSVIDCIVCGFCHLNPIPELKDLEKMYAHHFYQSMKPKYIKKDESELSYWNITFDDKLDTIESKIRKKKKKILDIGCGPGFFLKRAKERGWNVLGVEPSTTAAHYAKSHGIPIIESLFEQYQSHTSDKFDAIHSKFLLEHVIDPSGTCKSCYNLLNKGGIVCFEVPNDFNILQNIVIKTMKKPYYWVASPEHVNYFTPKSLMSLLRKSGFKIVYTESTFPLELFLLFGLDYVGNDKVGQKIHGMRMKLETAIRSSGYNELKRELYNYLAHKGLGREFIVYAQKNK